MNKKPYMQPEAEVVVMQLHATTLLAGSNLTLSNDDVIDNVEGQLAPGLNFGPFDNAFFGF